MSDSVLFGKLAFAALGFVGVIALTSWHRMYSIRSRQFNLESFSILLISRVGAFIAVFLGMGLEPHSTAIYYGWTQFTLAGGVPPQHYGALFTYVTAAAVRLWDSPQAIVVLAILFEALSFPFWLAVGRHLFPEMNVRTAALLYIGSPIALYNVAVLGQNQVWIAAFLAVALLLLLRHRDLASGLALGVSIVVVKFLSLIFVPVLAVAARRRFRWSVGFAIIPFAIITTFLAIGVDLAAGMRFHAHHVSSGNIPYLLTAAGLDLQSPMVLWIVNFAGLCALAGALLVPALAKRTGGQCTIHLITIVLLVLLLVSKKSFSAYLVTALFAFCLTLAARPLRITDLLMFAFFGVIVMLESSLWFRWMKSSDLNLLWILEPANGINSWQVTAFLACELILLICYGYYLARAYAILWQVETAATRPHPGHWHLRRSGRCRQNQMT